MVCLIDCLLDWSFVWLNVCVFFWLFVVLFACLIVCLCVSLIVPSIFSTYSKKNEEHVGSQLGCWFDTAWVDCLCVCPFYGLFDWLFVWLFVCRRCPERAPRCMGSIVFEKNERHAAWERSWPAPGATRPPQDQDKTAHWKSIVFSSKILIFHWKNVGLGPKRVFYITFSGEKGWFWEKMTIFIWKYV